MNTKSDAKDTRTNSLGWMIQRLARWLDGNMAHQLAELDMNLQQFAVMMVVLENDGLTQSDIGSSFGMPAYAISRALDGLEEKGYVERLTHPQSRRAHHIQATKTGVALAPQMFAVVKSVNDELAAPLNKLEKSELSSLLQKVMTGI